MDRASIVFVFFLVQFSPVAAENGTQTSLDELAGWQANAARRGTLDILQNCLFTILACTWSVQHLNLPSPEESWYAVLRRKIRWTILTILCPEIVMAQALAEREMAYKSMKEIDDLKSVPQFAAPLHDITVKHPRWLDWLPWRGPSRRDNEWTLTHSFYANMGGFYLYFQPDKVKDPRLRTILEDVFECSGKLDWFLQESLPIPLTSLTTYQLAHCLGPKQRHGLASFQLPGDWVSEEDITDKNKSDWFTKTLALVQLVTLGLSLIVRKVRGMASSQLEILTLVFALCGLTIYILRWYKPQGVAVATKVWLELDPWLDMDREEHRDHLTNQLYGLREYVPDRLYKIFLDIEEGKLMENLDRVRNDNIDRRPHHKMHHALFALWVLLVIVGAIHLIAWDFSFPTYIEQTLWKVSCLVMIGVPAIPCIVIPIARSRRWEKGTSEFWKMCRAQLSVRDPDRLPWYDVAKDALDHYRDIFRVDSEDFAALEQAWLEEGWPPKEFHKLADVMREIGKEYRDEADGVDFFPPKNLDAFSQLLFYLATVMYCVARLSILALALSTLRQMPDSVFEATWVDVIPNVT